MRLENSFDVQAPPEAAWRLLNDVPRIVPCMPGAELKEVIGENAWKATLHVKLGPIALQFSTDVTRDLVDESEHRVVLTARARELKGRGGARAAIESAMMPASSGTRVSIVTDLTLQGAVAQYGRGVVADVAAQLTKRFSECIARQLEESEGRAGPEAVPGPADFKPVGGLRLALSGLWRSLVRLIRRR